MAKIKSIFAHKIIDSKGNSAIETTVILADGAMGTSSVSAGVLKGSFESTELWDHTEEQLHGAGEKKAIDGINIQIAQKLMDAEASEQTVIDRMLIEIDGTQDKSNLGANSMLSVSQAVLKAAAKSSSIPLTLSIRKLLSNDKAPKKIPQPLLEMYEGGRHVTQRTSSFQEFLLIPASSKTYEESLAIGTGVYQSLQGMLQERNVPISTADEGGFYLNLLKNREALQDIKMAIEKTPYRFALDVFLGIDASANGFSNGKLYSLKDKPEPYSREELVDYYKKLQSDFSLLYLEDPFRDDDWEGWKNIFAELSSKVLIVGDDLTATNPYRLQLAFENNVVNGIAIQPVQIGTITESIAVAEIARFKNLKIVVSERSSDTEDTFLADFAVGIGADYIKFGAPARERAAKYNRILEIQKDIEKM